MNGARILLVEDDKVTRMVIAEGLRQHRYEVLEAESGEAALALCERERIDLAILDYRLPEMSGLEIAEHCRNVHNIPFLFLTVMEDPAIARQAVERGAYGYLVKPARMPELLPQVEAALGHASETKRLKRAASDTQLINIALGILMARHGLTREGAFARLRRLCRPRSLTAREAAERIVATFEAAVEAQSEPGGAGDPAD